jgi:superfamily II RNA helicase
LYFLKFLLNNKWILLFSSYTYFTLYGKSLTNRDVKVDQPQIFLPNTSTSLPDNENNSNERSNSPSSASDGKKNKPNKREIIRKEIEEKQRKERITAETAMIEKVKDQLKQIPFGNYSDGLARIDGMLPNIETPEKRWELLKLKLKQQKKYLRLLKMKDKYTIEEKSKFELLQIEFFATMSEIVNLKIDKDPLPKKREYMEELVDDSPLDEEKWYRFQMKKINSRLPRREKGIPDIRAKDFIPDRWQLDFLNAVSNEESIIIVAPTASG